MRLRMNDRRERRFKYLQEATGENTKSGALDVAADYYLVMAGGTGAHPNGLLHELIQSTEEQGRLPASEIAEILDTPQLPIQYEQQWSVGDE